jgi:hypothetical protein
MISHNTVKHSAAFVTAFQQVFAEFLENRNRECSSDACENEPAGFVLSVRGMINGYLTGIRNGHEKIPIQREECQHVAEILVSKFNKSVLSEIQHLSIIELQSDSCIDDILYSLRINEPEMTLKLRVYNYSLEFFLVSSLTVNELSPANCRINRHGNS